MLFKKIKSLVLVVASFALVYGCATTGTGQQADIDAMNAKIASLQAQLSEKDAEMARLSNQMKQEEAAREQAESERRTLSNKLDSALSQLEAKKSARVERPDSDLK
jgi:chromosome segregation ATPase